MKKRTWKIGNYTFWEDAKFKYTLCGQNLNDPKMDSKRSRNLYRWDPKFDTPTYGKFNAFECPIEIIMRAFIIIFPEVNEYSLYYNALFGGKVTNSDNNTTNTTVTNNTVDPVTNNTTVNVLIQALRQQAEMYEKALQQQIALNNANVENLIALATGGVQQNVELDTYEFVENTAIGDIAFSTNAVDNNIPDNTTTDNATATTTDNAINTDTERVVSNSENDVEVSEKKIAKKPRKTTKKRPKVMDVSDEDEADDDDIE